MKVSEKLSEYIEFADNARNIANIEIEIKGIKFNHFVDRVEEEDVIIAIENILNNDSNKIKYHLIKSIKEEIEKEFFEEMEECNAIINLSVQLED